MRRLWYLKYVVTLLASTALTFHLLHSKVDPSEKDNIFPSEPDIHQETSPVSYQFTKSNRYLMRKLSQGNLTNSSRSLEAPSWIVLSGNVTVHEGSENVPYEISYKINAENVCQSFDDSRRKLLIFVASSADHFTQRKVIRETWGLKMLQDAYNYRIIFLLGVGDETTETTTVQEGYRFGDLVQINLTESFRNLGRKSVAGLQWTKTFCQKAEFLMKTDDDILIHVPNLLTALSNSPNQDSLLMCHENRMRKILRKDMLDQVALPPSYHKYEVSENELPGEYYPPYCSGMAYLFSSAVRDRLLQASLATPVFFIEDVYLTGFCRHKAGVIITNHVGITLRPPIAVNQAAVCTFRDGRITSQEVGADELRQLWAELNTQGFFCPELVGYARSRSWA
ncbi:beta-1,3-galactosyltransferase 5-like [Uloborus diversus]|uniref:beta-1,3-galactosyltransferase 5-like n=1 Tax=Uloborus diversus TaxID=327109 RepID=UPI0024095D70|nr:beta-1,3-galactosyltransferase 5-like [Uloborus diversus]